MTIHSSPAYSAGQVLPHDGMALLAQAREALTGSIHLGLAVATVISAIALWWVRRVPHIPLVQQSEPVPMAE
jgi:hypothetical protein